MDDFLVENGIRDITGEDITRWSNIILTNKSLQAYMVECCSEPDKIRGMLDKRPHEYQSMFAVAEKFFFSTDGELPDADGLIKMLLKAVDFKPNLRYQVSMNSRFYSHGITEEMSKKRCWAFLCEIDPNVEYCFHSFFIYIPLITLQNVVLKVLDSGGSMDINEVIHFLSIGRVNRHTSRFGESMTREELEQALQVLLHHQIDQGEIDKKEKGSVQTLGVKTIMNTIRDKVPAVDEYIIKNRISAIRNMNKQKLAGILLEVSVSVTL